MSNKAIREALEALMDAGVIKKSAKSEDIRRILEQAQGTPTPPSWSERLMGKPGGLRRELTSGFIGGGSLLGLQRLSGERPATTAQPGAGASSKFTQSLPEEQAMREYLDQENYNRGVLRNLQGMLHKVTFQPGEYVAPPNLQPIDVDAKLREAQALRDNALESAAERARAQTAQEAQGDVARTREQQTAETRRRALDLLQQIYGTSRQAPAPLSQDQLDQPYQY